MDPALWTFAGLLSTALIAGIISPYVILKLNAREKEREKKEAEEERRRERLEDLENQEEVRRQVAEAARLLEEQDRKRKTDAKGMKDKLDVIHTLVDGQMTMMMEDQLDMAHVSLALLRAEAVRDPENAEAQVALRTMEEKVDRLTSKLEDRKRQVAVAEEQLRQQGER